MAGSRPSAPRFARVTLGNASARLTWRAPESAGDTAVDGYMVERSKDGAAFGSGVTTRSLSATLAGLKAGTEYWFRVRAHNAGGYGAAAGVGPRKAIAVPGLVTVVGTAGDGQVTLSFQPSTVGNSPIDHYRVEQHVPQTDDWTEVDVPTAPSSTIDGLTNGRAHLFRVSAHNAAGYGPPTLTDPLTPTGKPTAPLNPVLDIEGINEASWDPPANDGGHPVDLYRVQYWTETLPGLSTVDEVTTAALTVAVAAAGKFRVQAHNVLGWGDWCDPVSSPYFSG